MQQKDLVSLVLGLTDAVTCQLCVAGLTIQGEEAVPLLVSALDFAAFSHDNGLGDLTDEEQSLGREHVRRILIQVGDAAKDHLLEHMDDDNESVRYGCAYCLTMQGHMPAQAVLRHGLEQGLPDARLNDSALAVFAPPSTGRSDARRLAKAAALAETGEKALHGERPLNWTILAGIPLTGNSLRQRVEDLEERALEAELVESKIASMRVYLEAVRNRKVKGHRKTKQLADRYWQPVIDSLPDSSLKSVPGLALNYLIEIWIDFKGATGKRNVSADFLDEIGKIEMRLQWETAARQRELAALRSIPAGTRRLSAKQLAAIYKAKVL